VSRATDWAPLCASDPTPGEPDEVRRAGARYTALAEEIKGQVARLEDIVSGTLAGAYVTSLTEAADGLKDELGRVQGRYREVGGVLQTNWAPKLEGFQEEAEGLRRQAAVAGGQMSQNGASPTSPSIQVDAPPATDAEVAAAKARQGRYDDAHGDLNRLQARLGDLTDRRDAAAVTVAGLIHDSLDDHVADNLWDHFKDWMDEHAELVANACKVLGVIAMAACLVALLVPGLNVLAAGVLMGVSVAATTGSLLGHTALASSGNGPWTDVGMDAFALATLGAGKFFTTGVTVPGKLIGSPVSKHFGGALERLAGEAKAAGAEARGNAARGPVQAGIKTDVAQARQRLVGGASTRVAGKVSHQVKAIRLQGAKESQAAFDSASEAYTGRTTVTTFEQRLALGGGDPELARMRAQIQDAARGFSPSSKVGLAVAKAQVPYLKALISTSAANVATPVSVFLEDNHPAWYVRLRDASFTREGGHL
jgi:hypothetical protein